MQSTESPSKRDTHLSLTTQLLFENVDPALQVEYSFHLKCLELEVFQLLGFFRYQRICIDIIFGIDPKSKHKMHYVSYTPYMHILRVIVENILVYLHFHYNLSHEVRHGIYHLWHHVGTQKVLDFVDFGFQIFRLEMLNLYQLF